MVRRFRFVSNQHPALPPEEHGGCIDCLNWVGPRTKEFLCNPDRLIRKVEDIQLPPMPVRVHIKEGDKMSIAFELVRRRDSGWIPLETVFTVRGTPIF